MPYSVKKTDHDKALERHRERLYLLTFISGLANLLLIFLHLIDGHNVISGILLGATVGSLIIGAIRSNTDSYYQSLSTVGLRWAAFAIGIIAFVLLPISAKSNSLVTIFAPGLLPYTTDEALIVLLICLAYHLGFSYAFLRDWISDLGTDHE